jgi:hypothetical protein
MTALVNDVIKLKIWVIIHMLVVFVMTVGDLVRGSEGFGIYYTPVLRIDVSHVEEVVSSTGMWRIN